MSLDCIQRHSVAVYDRGAQKQIAELIDVAEVRWGRVRDDISEANIKLIGASCAQQNDVLEVLRSGRHELVLYRGDDRVWEGPITRLTARRDLFEIHARDVMHYASRTVMRGAYNNAYPNVDYVIDRAALIMNTEMARKEALSPAINVLPHLALHQTATDAKTSASTKAYEATVWEHIDSLAARGSMDYTAIGRSVHFWDTHAKLGQTRTVTQNDFLGDIIVTEYGMELATHSYVTDGQGNYGAAGTNHEYYGEIEMLHTAYDEASGDAPPTSAEMASQAQRNLSGRMPAPIQVRIPDNSGLNPNGIISVHDLVPGVWMPLRAEVPGFRLEQMQKIENVDFLETPSGESITLSLFPASIEDQPEEE